MKKMINLETRLPHATLEQLLEIQDGVRNDVSDHVADCEYCQLELVAIAEFGQGVGQQLFAQASPASDDQLHRVWQRIQNSSVEGSDIGDEQMTPEFIAQSELASKAATRAPRFQWNSLSTAVYSLALAVVLTGLISLFNGQQQNRIEQQTQMLQASIEELMLNSRGLESVLQKVAAQNPELTSEERRAADRLYWRLKYVDQLIHDNAGDNDLDSDRVRALWGNRINALTELNQIYSNEQQVVPGYPGI